MWVTINPGAGSTVFYAVCPGETDCYGAGSLLQQGTAISFTQQAGKQTFIHVFYATSDAYVSTIEAVYSAEGFFGSVYPALNQKLLDKRNKCTLTFRTPLRQGDRYWDDIQRVAAEWSRGNIKLFVVHDDYQAPNAPIPTTVKDLNLGKGNDGVDTLQIKGLPSPFLPEKTSEGEGFAAGSINYALVNSLSSGKLNAIVGSDIVVDTNNSFFTGWVTIPDTINKVVAGMGAHEFGFALGLPVNTRNDSIMSKYFWNDIYNLKSGIAGKAWLLPSDSDIADLNARYPQCAPKPPAPAKVFMAFFPNPAKWHDNDSGSTASACDNGKVIIPNIEWRSNLNLEETGGSSGATFTNATVDDYKGNNKKTTITYKNFSWRVDAGTTVGWQVSQWPRKDYIPDYAIYTLNGKDDLGNPITVTGSMNIDHSASGKPYKLADCNGGGSPTIVPIITGGGPGQGGSG